MLLIDLTFKKIFIYLTCRLTMYNLGLCFFGLSMHHNHGYRLRTFKLEPKQIMTSAFSAAFEAPSQFIGHLIEPLKEKHFSMKSIFFSYFLLIFVQ